MTAAISRYNQVFPGDVLFSRPEELDAVGEGVSLPVTFVPFDPDGDEPGEDDPFPRKGDPFPGEGDPLPGEGVGESLVVGEVVVGVGRVSGVELGSGSGVVSGARRTLNTAGALVALTLWLLMN